MSSAHHSRQRHADLETPVSAYLKLRGLSPWSFLLESVEGREQWSSYSILGVGARRIFRATGSSVTVTDMASGKQQTHTGKDALEALRTLLAANPLQAGPDDAPACVGGVFGFVAYDAVRCFEPLPGVDEAPEVDDLLFVEPELLAVFNNRRHTLTLYARDAEWLDRADQQLSGPLPAQEPAQPWQEPQARESRASFQDMVRSGKEHIRAGDVIQVVLSRRFDLPRLADPFDVYRGLRVINPSPYLYYLNTPKVQLAGASPEVMVRIDQGRVTVRPIAGTRKRGTTASEDEALAKDLLVDAKERAEHIMLVDLGRNDVGRVGKPGSVEVTDFMVVEHYSHVMHMVSQVEGDLKSDYDAFDALRASFPAGTLSGAPKVRAMQIIDELEQHRRGVYGGAVGYFGPRGDADFGIAIRTLVATGDGFAVQAGAGIVADSDPVAETDETENKAQAVLRAARWATTAQARR